jgi:hypothetical protein
MLKIAEENGTTDLILTLIANIPGCLKIKNPMHLLEHFIMRKDFGKR